MRVVADLTRLIAPAALAVSTAGGFAAAGVAASAPAAAAGGCPSATSGVTVVVQFPSGTATGCAPGNPGTALNALRSAGFSTVGSVRFHDAVVCAINNFPSATPCVMPPTSGYWAIFWANRGGHWTYSNLGVASLTVTPGQAVGFRFGTGTAPSAPVPVVVKPSPTPSKPAPSKPSSPKPVPTSTKPAPKTTTPAKPAPSASSSHATSKPSPSKSSGHAAGQNAPSSTSAGQQSTAATSAPTATSATTGSTAPVTVTATKSVVVDGKKKQVITFGDGSSITVDPTSKDAKKYRVGVAKEGASGTASAPMTTDVPQPSNSSHPSISTSGSVPAMPAPEAKGGGHSNLPGILAGVGVLGVAGLGAGYTAMRRRG